MRKFVEYKKELLDNSRNLRKIQTQPEFIVWSRILCRRQMRGHKFLRQKPIGGYIVDFYCPQLLLAIEIDGDTHDFGNEKDKIRTEEINKLGIEVVRYSNHDVMKNIEGVYEDLERRVVEREKLIKPLPASPYQGRRRRDAFPP